MPGNNMLLNINYIKVVNSSTPRFGNTSNPCSVITRSPYVEEF